MTECNQDSFEFEELFSRQVVARFDGNDQFRCWGIAAARDRPPDPIAKAAAGLFPRWTESGAGRARARTDAGAAHLCTGAGL